MFGLTFEKLLVVLVLAAVIVGPHRLPLYAQRLGAFLRTVRGFVEATRARVETEVGTTLAVDEWRSLDPRQYDPRRIVREALAGPAAGPDVTVVGESDAAGAADRPGAQAGHGADPSPRAAAGSDPAPVPASPVPVSAVPASAVPAPRTRSGGGGIADLIARGVAAHPTPADPAALADPPFGMQEDSPSGSVRTPDEVAAA